jgi:hypothetical protein
MVNTAGNAYLLSGGAAELERLRLQARVWEPAAEQLLDQIGIAPGWRCLDLGWGGMGILGPLSRRAGPSGHVLGVDRDAQQLAAARAYVAEERLTNLGDSGFRRLCDGTTRCEFPPGPRAFPIRSRRTRRRASDRNAPARAAWWHPRDPGARREFLGMSSIVARLGALQTAILQAFRAGGGDFDAGVRTFGLLCSAGVTEAQVRSAVIALQDGHPYMRLPIQFATSLRHRILDGEFLTESELDAHIAACEEVVRDPATWVTTFILTQVWGRAPEEKRS